METGLRGQVVLLTGASGGIGRAAALRFHQEGARLALVAGRRVDELERFASEHGLRDALCLGADIRSERSVSEAFRLARERFGRVDVCVANAGIWPAQDAPVQRVDPERVREVVDTNLLGALWTARGFFRTLEESGPGGDGHGASLCLVGSTAGRFGERGHVEYAATKAALHGILGTLKNEIVRIDPYGRVNLVEPGWTATPMTEETLGESDAVRRALRTMPLRQLARAGDIADAILFLSAPRVARHVSGQALTVAGGMEGRLLWQASEVDLAEVHRRLAEGD